MSNELALTGGTKAVTTAGTGERLVAASTRVIAVVIQAKKANTGNVYVGDSTVDKTTSQQIALEAGESVALEVPKPYYFDLYNVWVDVATNGEGVNFVYMG